MSLCAFPSVGFYLSGLQHSEQSIVSVCFERGGYWATGVSGAILTCLPPNFSVTYIAHFQAVCSQPQKWDCDRGLFVEELCVTLVYLTYHFIRVKLEMTPRL